MAAVTVKDNEKSKQLSYELLVGCGLSGFRFDTSFTLYFSRENTGYYNNQQLPWSIELDLLGEWWLGTLEEWKSILEKLAPEQVPDPDEPVKAHQLTCLRWSEGSVVEQVQFDTEYMTITFKNKQSLSIELSSDEDYSWVIKEPNVDEPDAIWSVTCENTDLYMRTPE